MDEVLETLALADRADDRVSTFSGGMKRRLNLGVGIVHEPRILFSTNRPPASIRNRATTFSKRSAGSTPGITIVYTSHYMEEVQSLCTRVGILDHGELIACDSVTNLLHRLRGQIHFHLTEVPESLTERLHAMPDVNVRRQDGQDFVLSARDVPRRCCTWRRSFPNWASSRRRSKRTNRTWNESSCT